jgi:hypothetical protein
MVRAAAKAIDGALKELVFVFYIGVINGGLNNSDLIVG